MAVTLAEVTKLYVATFNRAPDTAGINYWANSGMSIENIAQSFFDQPETQTLYPSSTTNSSFVTSVYGNLFNRTPDQEGLNYWVSELNNGNVSKQNFILAVINGAQNTTISQDATILTNKADVGLHYISEDLNSNTFSLLTINADAQSVQNAMNAVDELSSQNTLALAQALKTDDEDDLFFTFDNHIYIAKNDLKTWQQASDDANSYVLENGKEGHLVQIDSAEENAYLFSKALELSVYSSAPDGGGIPYIWAGGNDLDNEGNWQWNNGTPIATYLNWGAQNGWSEPDNYGYNGQDALGLALAAWPYGNASQWNDINENNTMPYIVEIA